MLTKRIFLLLIASMCFLLSFSQVHMTAQEKDNYKKQWIDMCRTINQQCPIRVDEVTELRSMVFYNWTVTTNYVTDIDWSLFEETEKKEIMYNLKRNMKAQMKQMYAKGKYSFGMNNFSEVCKLLGLKFRYNYMDEDGKLIGVVTLDYKDFRQN